MGKKFYRFRSMDSLIGKWKELETQTIFFAGSKELNDPMEGFRDIFWSGDYVVWMNFFKNYLMCVERVLALYKISGDDVALSGGDIPVFSGMDDLPTDSYREIFQEMVDEFLGNSLVIKLAEALSNRTYPIRRNELIMYLQNIHFLALLCIDKIHSKHNLGKAINLDKNEEFMLVVSKFKEFIDSDLTGKLQRLVDSEESGSLKVTTILRARNAIQTALGLRRKLGSELEYVSKNRDFVFIDFNEHYIERLEKLIFPDWYTACFMTECKNSSVWGHYGNNHEGVCLIFDSEDKENRHSLSLEKIVSVSNQGYSYDYSKMELHEVNYIDGFDNVDFFRMLGVLPVSKLNSEWYFFGGVESRCSQYMKDDENGWRMKYWNLFLNGITQKTQDWKYENEYRVILTSSLFDLRDPKKRTLRYDFSSLKGIIFGIKTKNEDKVEIIKIINSKVKENNIKDFKFYQAYYDPEKKCIENHELSFLSNDLDIVKGVS